jgi:hypothetical protein
MFTVVIIADDAEFAEAFLKVFAEAADELNEVNPAGIETCVYGQAPWEETP